MTAKIGGIHASSGNILSMGQPPERIGRRYLPAAHRISNIVFEYPAAAPGVGSPATPRRLRGPGRDMARSIEANGFPEYVRPQPAKRTYHANPCHDSSLTPSCVVRDDTVLMISGGAKRHLSAEHKNTMTADFLSRSLTPPPSSRKRIVGSHTLLEHVATNRVLVAELQDEPKPHHFAVRVCVPRSEDTLSSSLQGVQEEKQGKLSRRRFFELRK